MRRLLVTLAGVASLALAGCGFTPLYAEPGVSPGLSSIQVVAPQGRVGYLLRESLDDALAHRQGAPPAYRLDLALAEGLDPLGLTVDDVTRRYQVTLTVNYTLTELATGQVATRGVATSFVSYDAASQPYAAIVAREDVQQRAADDVARKIRMDLATWFLARNRRG